MPSIQTRSELPDDQPGIRKVHCAAFPGEGEANLVDLLRAAGHLPISLVALIGGEVIGHAGFSPVSTVTPTTSGGLGAGLAPLGVLPSFQRQGVGAALVETGLAACRTSGFSWVVVLGDPAYYVRFGFQPAPDFGLSDEYGGGAAFQVLELVPGTLPTGAGLVRYAPEFASLAE